MESMMNDHIYLEESQTFHKRPSIVCIMCKCLRVGDERMYMFGGSRPFMAKFETKLTALIGSGKFTALCDEHMTKFERRYICKHCYRLVNNTFNNIVTIQRGIANSVKRMKSLYCSEEPIWEQTDSDIEDILQQVPTLRKKLPPVVQRISEKIASLTIVRIDNKVPLVILKPVIMLTPKTEASTERVIQENRLYLSVVDEGQDDNDALTSQNDSQNHDMSKGQGYCHFLHGQSQCHSEAQDLSTAFEDLQHKTDNLQSPCQGPHCIESTVMNTNRRDKNIDVSGDVSGHMLCDQATHAMTRNNWKHSAEKLAGILSYPSLLVKSPQPVKLADVRNQNVYICGKDGCDWVFSSKYFWENHIRHYHYYGKPFQCPFEGCNRYFSTKSRQTLHTRQHTDERPFMCEVCGKAFRGSQELVHHKKAHTGGKSFRCPRHGCGQRYKYKTTLMRHLHHHDGYCPFPCNFPDCGRSFKNKYELKCHYRRHTGEKPIKCPKPGCGKSFRLPCEYTKHKRQHTGERPFRCTVESCGVSYVTCGGLSGHMLTHSTENMFCCELCGKTFKHKMSYVIHYRTHSVG